MAKKKLKAYQPKGRRESNWKVSVGTEIDTNKKVYSLEFPDSMGFHRMVSVSFEPRELYNSKSPQTMIYHELGKAILRNGYLTPEEMPKILGGLL